MRGSIAPHALAWPIRPESDTDTCILPPPRLVYVHTWGATPAGVETRHVHTPTAPPPTTPLFSTQTPCKESRETPPIK